MVKILRLDASIRRNGSVTRALADTVESTLRDQDPTLVVARRDVGTDPLPADVWAASTFAGERTEASGPVTVVQELVDELLDADALLFASPLYNFGVSQHFKTWVDVVISDPRLAPGSTALRGRPAILVTARGGGYAPGTPREGWDHATGWKRRILSDVWGLDLQVVETELTLADSTPQMADLRGLAREQLDQSHELARQHALALGEQLRTPV